MKKEEILKICKTFDFSILNDEIIQNMPLDNDLIKGINSNKAFYIRLKNNIKPISEYTFFQICHLLGFFSKQGEELDTITHMIRYFYLFYKPEEIDQFMNGISEVQYKEKYAKVLMKAIFDDSFHQNIAFYIHLYHDFKKISKEIKTINDNRVNIIHMKPRELKEDTDSSKVQEIRRVGKAVTLPDIKDYIAKEKLLQENPLLDSVASILKLETYDADALKEIIEFFNDTFHFSKEDEKYLINESYNTSSYTMRFLPGTDPLNLVLGYLLKICSTYYGSGSKIMVESMTNSKVKNIVLQNRAKTVLGKATVVLRDYYLFSNAFAYSIPFCDKLTNTLEDDLLYQYLCILSKQAKHLLDIGYPLEEIRLVESTSVFKQCIKSHKPNPLLEQMIPLFHCGWIELNDELFNHEIADYVKEKRYHK